jgi:tetratricopeptide (TPR) repeat protein
MRLWNSPFTLSAALGLAAGIAASGGDIWASAEPVGRTASTSAGVLLSANDPASAAMRFLEDRVRRDPEDAGANAKLAGIYLQRVRETGSIEYLDLARRAARASLASVPAIRNTGGLAALVQAEFASHEFATARDHALELVKLDPGRGYAYGLLSDALLELGDYDEASAGIEKMVRAEGRLTVGSESRQAHVALLHGDIPGAQRRFSNALALARDLPVPPRETVAWCQWKLGDVAFSTGHYEAAEQHYRDALATFPDYVRALASLGRVRAARGDLQSAIEHYRRAVGRLPDPTFVAALGDLYKLAGRDKEAEDQYLLVEQIGHLSAASGAVHNRQLALFHADHDLKADAAYANATREYSVRRDVYGADAVAWTALKAHKVDEAQAAIKKALRLGTQDAKLFYHAGMIARAAGDETAARGHIKRALALSPQFDPLQAFLLQANFAE